MTERLLAGIQAGPTFHGLAELRAGDFVHLDGTLVRHLIAVHDLLTTWGADQALRLAGLYHAAYGTTGFETTMVSTAQRGRIAALIGTHSEKIVYTYCACAREAVWPRIDARAEVEFLDRFTGIVSVMKGDELKQFCELTCANEVEIAANDPIFALGTGRHLGRLFTKWEPHLSEPARQAIANAFNMF